MDPEISGVAAVVLGTFNPQSFQPYWFSSKGLIADDEAEGAKVDILIPDLAAFTAGPHSFNISRNKFHVSTANTASFDVLRDLTFGTFEILSSTPVTAVGLNRQYHIKMKDEEAWHGVGFRLVPRENFEKVLDPPGLEHLRVRGPRHDSDRPGLVRITVQPSVRVTPHGVYIEVNDHFDLVGEDDVTKMESLLELLKEEWEPSLQRSEDTAKVVVEGP